MANKVENINFNHQRCAICGKREATRYCDYIVEYQEAPAFFRRYLDFHNQSMHETCDVALCDECACRHGGVDFCPYHERLRQRDDRDFPHDLWLSRMETRRRELEESWKTNG